MNTEARAPGRPRDETLDDSIVQGLFELVDEVGINGCTIDAIAERAGVSKASIYRRWSSKEDLLVDAIAGLVGGIEIPDGDSVRDVLLHALGRLHAFMSKSTAGVVLPWMISEVARGTEIGRHYVEAVIVPGRAALAGHISQAIDSGELRSDLDVDLAVDMILGPLIINKLLRSQRETREGWTDDFIDALLEGWKG